MYLALKLLHILSSTVLFGTGLGTTFSMWRAQRLGDPRVVAAVARNVVLADWVCTTPAVIVQPVTGLAMMHLLGSPLTAPWLRVSVVLYGIVGACRLWFAPGWPAFLGVIAICALMVWKPALRAA